MENVLNNIITDVDQAEAFLNLNIPSAPNESDSVAVKEQIKQKHRERNTALNAAIAEQLKACKAQYDSEVEKLDKELAEKLKVIEEKYSAYTVEQRAEKKCKKEYKDEVSGAKTVHLRSMRKLNNDYDREAVAIKAQQALLYQARNKSLAKLKGKNSDGQSIGTAFYNFKASFNPKKTLSNKHMWVSLTPFLVLVILIIAYVCACQVNNYKMNIDTILTSGIYVAIVAAGAVFIYSQGAFDMSLGNACLVCAAVGIMSYAATGNVFLSLVLCVILGVVLGIVNAVLANCLKLPVMVMTLTMQSVLSAVYSNITSDSGGYIEVQAMRGLGGMGMKWAILVVFVLLCIVIFNYTKVGRRSKMIGANATCAKCTGISLMKAGIISFAISGIGLGLCGFLYITQMGSVNATGTALTSVGLNVIIAINLGGMPTSGGPKSRIAAALVGGFFCAILDEFFAAVGLDLYRYLAKGIIFLVAVCLTSIGNRPKRLA